MSEPDLSPEEELQRSERRRKRILWGLSSVLVVLVLALTPPLLNMNRYSRRITSSMSESLGRQVTVDRIELNLLPLPGLTLRNLVVNDDPSFSAEPVIRAMKVQARLRVSSLWRRQVEFSTVSFGPDENGSAPSVNLVQRADGRWNFESILLHAAQRETAPTTQTVAGPAPRFPYIEVSGARLNVKKGLEKLPLSLMDTDFALWLPSPRQWRLRLTGRPARTNTTVTDGGELTAEATLQRADRMSDVPLEATVQWKRAPLGEASRLMFAADAGWRGTGDATVNLRGTLSDATLHGVLHLTDVRRVEFIPEHRMDLTVDCTGRLNMVASAVREPACSVPVTGGVAGASEPAGAAGAPGSTIAATADAVTLSPLHAENLRVGMTSVPDGWLVNWARVVSERVPGTLSPAGTASGTVQLVPGSSGQGEVWQGQFQGSVQMPSSPDAKGKVPGDDGGVRTVTLSAAPGGWVLAPVNLAAGSDKSTALMLSGTLSRQSYTLQVNGTAAAARLRALAAMAPPLADGAEAALPGVTNAAAEAPVRVDLTCTRVWGSAQTCLAMRAPEPAAKQPARHRRGRR